MQVILAQLKPEREGFGGIVASMELLDAANLAEPVSAARHLLGSLLLRTLTDGTVLTARIVEVEAYFQEDPASHTFAGPTRRNVAMFGPPGHAYIYLSYGLHWCLNVTAGPVGYGAGVLIRAVEPLTGVARMEELRGRAGRELANGPGKLTRALAVGPELYGHDLRLAPLQVADAGQLAEAQVIASPRIGISRAKDELLRFHMKDSVHVSRR